MAKISEIYSFLQETAPLDLQLGFDNSGLQLGRTDTTISDVLLSLDATPFVVDEAIRVGAGLIISHHPILFDPVKSITDEKLLRLIENKITVISMHTNLDVANGGVNDALLAVFGLKSEGFFEADNCGRYSSFPTEMSMNEFLPICKAKLGTSLRYVDCGRPVKRLAVLGGAGGFAIEDAFNAGCDTFITSDIKYHQFLLAAELGINLIDGDHFCTENFIIPIIADRLKARFTDTEFRISKVHGQVVSFF